MLTAEILSTLIKLSQGTKQGRNRLYYFIIGALYGRESSHLKG